MLSAIYAKRYVHALYAVRRYIECRYAGCRHAEFNSAKVLNGKRLVV